MNTPPTSRLRIVDPASATGAARRLLDGVQAQLGATPNFIRVLANSPAALEGFLGLFGALGGASLDKATQERIALVVAQRNESAYCLAAHTALGRQAGLSDAEMMLARGGGSADAKAAAVVALARALNEHTGELTNRELDVARAAGIADAEIVEVIAVVALTIFTNILAKATRVDIDFPSAP